MFTLKNVLLINAISSGATGLGLVIAPAFVADLFEVSQAGPFVEVGIFLIAFATLVLSVGLKQEPTIKAVRLIIVLDTLWVVGSFGIVLFQLFSFSVLGYLVTAAVALWVGAMAFLQQNGLKQIKASN
jgi:hypothetical protein